MNVSDINGIKAPGGYYNADIRSGQYQSTDYQASIRRGEEDYQVAGIKYRPRSGEKSINEVFQSGLTAP